MPKLPVVSAAQVVKALKKIGFREVSQKGSHIKVKHPDARIAIVPNHKVIKKGTLKKGILNPLGISVDDFSQLL
ncbi:type II toxin-antitoxin system HicA family toxin [Candidatus Gottesmanbacteria bacterium]|nr:type II toxin-antitoxin system HicA family toxin [Candidatus Gottesmanbacteria bacterium]